MTTAIKTVYSKALDLPPIKRAELVELLLSSFDFKNREKIDSSWANETESRIDAYDSGKMGSRPVSHMFAAVQKRHRK